MRRRRTAQHPSRSDRRRRRLGRRGVVVLVGALVLVLAGAGFGGWTLFLKPSPTAAPQYRTITVSNGRVKSTVSATGKLVDGAQVPTEVAIGQVVGTSTVITEGLTDGDEIVVASFTARSGTGQQIVNADHEVIATYTTSKTVQNVVVSTAGITAGDEYAVHTGGTPSGATTGGLSAGGELGSSTSVATVTADQTAAGGVGGGGGGPR